MSGFLSWALPAAAGIGSALLGANASKSAANTAANAATAAAAQSSADLAPWRDLGTRMLPRLEAEVGTSFQTSPGYQFRMDEGVRAIDRAASARGLLGSGARLRQLTAYGQGLAGDEYNNYWNRLASLGGIGQTAAQQTAQTNASALMQAGQAQAAGGINATNATLGGLNAGLGLYSLMNPTWGNVARKPQRTED
jgi:hypothetical protein